MRSGDFGELLTDPYVLQFFGGPVQIFDPSQPVGARTRSPATVWINTWAALVSRYRPKLREPVSAADSERVFHNLPPTPMRLQKRITT